MLNVLLWAPLAAGLIALALPRVAAIPRGVAVVRLTCAVSSSLLVVASVIAHLRPGGLVSHRGAALAISWLCLDAQVGDGVLQEARPLVAVAGPPHTAC